MDSIHPELTRRILERFGFAGPPRRTLGGLNELYRAWCRHVPFDNVRKRIALASGNDGPLPGTDAADFFASWLQDGTGGTCWPTSNALCVLLQSCGFEARRISGSMRDLGAANHGSVIVRLEGRDFLVDSSMLTESVLPLRRAERAEIVDPVHPAVVEPVEDSWRIWFAFPMSSDTMPCRLLDDPVDHAYFCERYELSRQVSPFNNVLYARLNRESALVCFVGRSRFVKTARGVTHTELGARQLAESLRQELGFSAAVVRELAATVAL